eukprot:8080077-Pyramimonas_sp.AAC.1
MGITSPSSEQKPMLEEKALKSGDGRGPELKGCTVESTAAPVPPPTPEAPGSPSARAPSIR